MEEEHNNLRRNKPEEASNQGFVSKDTIDEAALLRKY